MSGVREYSVDLYHEGSLVWGGGAMARNRRAAARAVMAKCRESYPGRPFTTAQVFRNYDTTTSTYLDISGL